jgi:sugar O-acyltransferase (sialic acid O-acetyltransferase NeuD family)
MKRILIVGAGGHGQVVADILSTAQEAGSPFCPIGFVDDSDQRQHQTIAGLPVLGKINQYVELRFDEVILAIGNNLTRSSLFKSFQIAGVSLAKAIHPSAVIAKNVSLGSGTVVCAGVVVNTGSSIGANVILNTACSVDHHNHVGDHVHIAPGAHTGGDVQIGNGSLIGMGAIVMPQRRVGAWSTVGAGSLVYENVMDGETVMGVPAKTRNKE